MARVNPKIDLVFKKLFGSEENKDILISLINAILPEDQQISEITLKNPYNVSDYAEGKLSILDIKAEDEEGNLYDIEMQIKGTTFYGKRTLYYWAKIFGSQLDYLNTKEGLEEAERRAKKKKQQPAFYTDLNKCIVISLMDFTFFKDDRYHRCFMLKDRQTDETHIDLDYLDLYFVELEKFGKKYETLKTTLDRWITFLNNADYYSKETLPEELAEIEPIKKASEKLEVMYFTEKERQYYDSQHKRYLDEVSRIHEEVQKGIKEGLEKAVEEVVEKAVEEAVEKAVEEAVEKAVEETVEKTEMKKQLEIAKTAIEKGFESSTIAELTGLTMEQVEKLRRE